MPKKGQIIEHLSATRLLSGGGVEHTVAAADSPPLTVELDARASVPGEVVTATLIGKRSGVWQGVIAATVTSVPARVAPPCRHFGTCGGCSLQHWDYALQLEQKQSLVMDCLGELASGADLRPITGCVATFHYRNKMEFTASARAWRDRPPQEGSPVDETPAYGLFVPYSGNKVLDIHECLLQAPVGDRVRNWLRDYATRHGLSCWHATRHDGWLRTLLVRVNRRGECLVMFIVSSESPAGGEPGTLDRMVADFVRDFPEAVSVWTLVNAKLNDSYADLTPVHRQGALWLTETLDGMDFRIGPLTFFQVNSAQTENLYRIIETAAAIEPGSTVYDLYCGTGTISAWLARRAGRVVGIEHVEQSVEAARDNTAANGIANCEFHAGDMKDLLTDEFFALHGIPEVIVTDPPRAGMHPKALAAMIRAGARRIVYVSCNPLSLARDLQAIGDSYRIVSIQAVDLMPHTPHVETVAVLEKR